ncbi:MAG: hydroxyisourate hydrolase [Armatimonadota bacterium]|nr:hydroxyisourate hydrolase [Armatimonadota bacterium]MDR7401739.1 hydroxyisourate hydrolase [Armatimonadota bacterium]MDR7404131.1 hydroxyisourate hydrolase [Armatimonadota bacterium]MDR7436258.1 hydroxyisourate hydrolase [Armatimonadota bacterium]MDR7471362.1 hydroxyisourate hydrolase [Armatimonadota bacterium]
MPGPTISTHVLDVGRGVPARGVRVDLYRNGRLVASRTTGDDGRIPDLIGGPLEAGTYRLVFAVPSEFFSRLDVEFTVTDPARHYHVPLVVGPYLCATYRGA